MKRRKTGKRRMSGVRRRRSSKMGAIDTTNIISVIGGAVIAGFINKVIPATVNDKIVAGGKVALGIALPMLVKDGGMKNVMAGVGAGMIAVGSVDLLKSFKVLNGDFDIPVINGDVLSGDVLSEDIDVINGDEDMMMNGDEDFLSGDDEDML
jgi:predicted YcjX-like family ATPase